MRINQVLGGSVVVALILLSGTTSVQASDSHGSNGDSNNQQQSSDSHSSDGHNGGDNNQGGDDGHNSDNSGHNNDNNNHNGDDGHSNPPPAVPGTLTIEKDTINGDGTFWFNISDGNAFSQNLTLTTVGNTAHSSAVSLVTGSYSVTETSTGDWILHDTNCTNQNGAVGIDLSTGMQISIENGDSVTCVFTNTYTAPATTTPPTDGTSTPPTDGGADNTDTTTPPTDNGFHGSSSGQRIGIPSSHGQVLGAETGPTSCVPPLTSYLRQGKSNDSAQVKALQTFLNKELGLNIPVTGYFGPITTQAVNQFQLKYVKDVLTPWVPFGFSDKKATGWVYKLTEWKINSISCPDNGIQMPILP